MNHYVIVGNSAAGLTAAETIRKVDHPGRVTVVSDEPFPSYSRVLTSYYLAGEVKEEDLFWRGTDIYERLGVEPRLGVRASGLNPEAHRLTLENGEELNYTKLLLATGARPQLPDISGINLRGIHTLRTLGDAQAIRKAALSAEKAVVVGGGLIALKAAGALQKLGLQVTMVVSSLQILSQNLDFEAAEIVQRHLEESGLRIELNSEVMGFERDSHGKVTGVVLASGRMLPCNVVIVGKGVQPNVELARCAGLQSARGITVNERLETSHADIYAAGDVCEVFDPIRRSYAVNAIWPNAVVQGRVAGLNMAGLVRTYSGGASMNSVVLAGLPVITAGMVRADSPEFEAYTQVSLAERMYKKLVVRDGKVVGLIFVGEIATAGIVLGLMGAGANVDNVKEHLLDDGFVCPRLYGAVGLKRA